MSSEAALAITNEKTIKDEDKDKLKWLVFHGNNDEDGVGVWPSASLSSAFWWQLRSLACVRASAWAVGGELVSGYLCVIMYVRPSWMVCLRQSGVWSSSGWTKLETEKQTFPRNPPRPPTPPPPPPPTPRLPASGAVQPVWDNVTVYSRNGPHTFAEGGRSAGGGRLRWWWRWRRGVISQWQLEKQTEDACGNDRELSDGLIGKTEWWRWRREREREEKWDGKLKSWWADVRRWEWKSEISHGVGPKINK